MNEIRSLVYVCSGWIPSRQANGLQTVKMCSAFAKLGLRTTLYYIPSPYLKDDPSRYYGVKTPLMFKPLPRAVLPIRKSFVLEKLNSLPSFVHAFIWSGFVTHLASRSKADLYFVRDPMIAWWLGRKGLPTVLEIHEIRGKEQVFIRWAAYLSSVKLVVTVTEHLRSDLQRQLGVPADKLLTLHDGVESDSVGCPIAKAEARERLGLPLDRPLVIYTGQLSAEKGVDVLVKAAAMLNGIQIVIVGDTSLNSESLQRAVRENKENNVTLVGFRSHSDARLFQKAADVLVLPHSMKFVHSTYYTSPLKLFEYMAAGVPIVATDLPSTREVIRHGQNGWLVKADDAHALAQGIRHVLDDDELAEKVAREATRDVGAYTWERRASAVLARAST